MILRESLNMLDWPNTNDNTFPIQFGSKSAYRYWTKQASKAAIEAVLEHLAVEKLQGAHSPVTIRVNRFIGAAPATRSIFTFNLRPMLQEARGLAKRKPFRIVFRVRDPDLYDRYATEKTLKETMIVGDHQLRCYLLAQPKKDGSPFNEWWDPYKKAGVGDDSSDESSGDETEEPV